MRASGEFPIPVFGEGSMLLLGQLKVGYLCVPCFRDAEKLVSLDYLGYS